MVWYSVGSSNYGAMFVTDDEWTSYATHYFSNPEGMGGTGPIFGPTYMYWDPYWSGAKRINLQTPGTLIAVGSMVNRMKMGVVANYNGSPSLVGGSYGGSTYYSTDGELGASWSSSTWSGDPNGANQGSSTSGFYVNGRGNYNGDIFIAGSFYANFRCVYKSTDQGQTFNEVFSAGGSTSGLEGDNMYGYFRIYPEAPNPFMWWVKNKQTNAYHTFTSMDGENWVDRGAIGSKGPHIAASYYGGAYSSVIHNRHTGKFYHTRDSTSVYESVNGYDWDTFYSNTAVIPTGIKNVALANDGSLFGMRWSLNGASHHAVIMKWTASGTTPNKVLSAEPTIVKTITDLDSVSNDGGVDAYGSMYPNHLYGPPLNW